ncbi:hypothetical protein LCGC14_1535900 [marine sediment metagenome]|uniref:Uncharacterized protein n=1 Tax=marine sediment metagenome TaxID=412755 RepID=A0A0F9IUI7_9ZZZZ
MAKYRRKPVVCEVVEAIQWFPGKEIEGLNTDSPETAETRPLGQPLAWIHTLEGTLEVSPGDWIITGINGERYPLKNDIFRVVYELVEETNPSLI